MEIKDIIKERFDASERYVATKRESWGVFEDILHNKASDVISGRTKSNSPDPKLSTLILEREARVMAQLATGKVIPISKNDMGAAKLMNLTLDKYVLPNANAQFDFLTKCRMVNRYSNVYGNYFVMVDWDVKKNGYQGPDMWLIPIRDVFPQVGAVSLDDSDHIIIRTWRPISFFEGLKKKDGYKNVDKILEVLKDKTGDKSSRDSNSISNREGQQYPQGESTKGTGYFQVLSMYERDRWVDYCSSADLVFRDGKNPHDDGELPLVNKYSIPLVDDFMGFGDTERGAPIQNTLNSVWNLYLDAVKMSIFPPTLINKDNIADPNSLKWSAAAKWLMRNNLSNSAQTLNLTPQGTNTFNNVYQVVTASLLNMFGTSQTNTTASTDPGFGKTPQALEMQASRENAKDSVDRFYMEQFLTKVSKKFVNLMSKQSTGTIQFRMFEEEIDQLSMTYPDVAEMYDKKTGKINIDKKKMGNLLYDYEIVSGSTYAVDQKQQQQNLTGLMNLVLNPQTFQLVEQSLQKEGKTLKIGEMFTRIISNSGIQDWDKIVVDIKNDPQAILDQQTQKFQQLLQQVGGVTGVPAQPDALANEPSAQTQLLQ